MRAESVKPLNDGERCVARSRGARATTDRARAPAVRRRSCHDTRTQRRAREQRASFGRALARTTAAASARAAPTECRSASMPIDASAIALSSPSRSRVAVSAALRRSFDVELRADDVERLPLVERLFAALDRGDEGAPRRRACRSRPRARASEPRRRSFRRRRRRGRSSAR